MKAFEKIGIVICLLSSFYANGQLKVTSTGNVGIGTTTPQRKFHVSGGDALIQCGLNKNFEVINWNISGNNCVTLNARNDDNTAHIPMSFASLSFYFHYGNVGIHRTNPSYPLDVNGAVRASSFYVNAGSSEKEMMSSQPENLLKLKTIAYTCNSLSKFDSTNGDVQVHYGFSKEDMQAFFPELTSKDNDGNISIDYFSLIPLIVEKLKSQNDYIESLKKELEFSKMMYDNSLGNVSDKSRGELFQNNPNPFNKTSIIKFRYDNKSSEISIAINNLQGKLIKTYPIENGNEFLEIKATELTPGVYIYSLVIDGSYIDTKTMIITQ